MSSERPQNRARRIVKLVRAASRGAGSAKKDLGRLWVLAESLDLAEAANTPEKMSADRGGKGRPGSG